MTNTEFVSFLKEFAERPIPSTTGRHLFIWQDTVEALRSNAPRGLITALDLHELCSALESAPSSREAAQRVIEKTIDNWLNQEFRRDDRQRLLVVTGCDLLMRYGVSLGQFVQKASESRIVTFVVPKQDSFYRPLKPLPSFVHMQPDATLSYLKNLNIPDEAIIGGMTQ